MELSGQVRQQRRLARVHGRPVAVMILSTRERDPMIPTKASLVGRWTQTCRRNLRVSIDSSSNHHSAQGQKTLESVIVISSRGHLIIVHRNDETREAGNGALVFDRKRSTWISCVQFLCAQLFFLILVCTT
jgi:hypothetical protein